MRKILSATFFFCLALTAAGSPRLGAEEPQAPAAVVDPAGGQTTQTAEPKLGPDAPMGRDIFIFKTNVSQRPDVSARALLRVLGVLPAERLPFFVARNSGRIAQMIGGLEIASAAGRITPEEYEAITAELRDFEVRTIQARRDGGPGAPGANMRRNAVDALVDVVVAGNSGDKEKKDAALETAVRENSDNPAVQVAAANFYNEDKSFDKAAKSATAALALDENDPDAYKARALARASLDDRKGAIEDIKKAMAIDPQDESARVLSALLESRKPVTSLKSVASVEDIKRALGAHEEAGDAVRGGGGRAMDALGGGAAGGELEGAARLSAQDFAKSKAYLKTAVAKNRLGDYESAVRYAGLALEKDPANNEAYLERANAYNFLGRYDDAVRDAGRVIENDPANMQAFNMRAWALNRKGQARDAATDASRAIGLNPGYADAWFNRALAYEKQGDYKRMLEDFRQAAALSGSYSSRYQDAVAQYGPQVPGFAGTQGTRQAAVAGAAESAEGRGPLKRFLTLMLFTLVGGGLVAAGLLHIMSSRGADSAAAPRSTHPDVLSPSVFYEGVATGKYKIERKLGEGAMGVVYEATDQSLGRKVAIKKMGDEIKVNDREKQRFLEEARTVALLHHPGIVEIYTIFEEEDNIYLVFEHVDGVTLDKELDKEGRLPWDRARKMFGEAASALAYAHSKNVVHRDLKLANIMLSGEGGVKVMDFGLAYRARESMARLSNAEVVGSPAYMAPEQELGESSVRSDVYSLGVCLYEALTGVLPFQGPDFHQQKTRRAYQRLTAAVPGLPAGADEVLDRCLDPDPEKRYASADDFASALDALG
ncbi:MAG: protein kinase [Elusimicrobiales bacterium]